MARPPPAPHITAPDAAPPTVPSSLLRAPSHHKTGEYSALRRGDRRAPEPKQPPRAIRVEREGVPPLTLVLYADREYVFGRSDDCTVVVPSEAVSRQHGRLAMSDADGRWTFRDLNSTNGSWLMNAAGDRVTTERRVQAGHDRVVRPGQVLYLGNARNRVVFLADAPEEARERALSSGSKAARELDKKVQVCARHRLPVFLLGPSGSGKTYFARRLHEQSGATGQFALVNCARLPSDHAQLTSQLLGHVKGAFTGADAERKGWLLAADGGTLFLDEVESMPEAAQGFLLDLLEGSGSWAPLGAGARALVEAPRFRLVSASKQPLGVSGLRGDLVQRLLMGEVIELPSLEDRREDIPAFVETFLKELEVGQQLRAELTADAIDHLKRSAWPGQVRELQTTIRVVVSKVYAERTCEGLSGEKLVIGVRPVREYLERRARGIGELPGQRADTTVVHRKRPQDLVREDLVEALREHRGNKTRAAAALGIAVNTLKGKLAQFRLR